MVGREDSLACYPWSVNDDYDEGRKNWMEYYGKVNTALFAKEILGKSDREAQKLSSYKEILDQSKGQIIFYGPPGTGKTYTAKLLAQLIRMEVVPSWTNTPQRKLIQFHPSYSYEDFVQGIKPVKDKVGDVSYELQPGIFQKLCQDYMDYNAKNLAVDKSTKVLIIDEINRGNLPKIFGELIYALEYRDEEVDLQYKEFEKGGKNGTLNIPESLKIIGTMNTADRSIVLFDTALRRRFSFIPLFPDYELLAEEFGLGGTLDDGFNNALQNQQLPDDEKHRTLSVLALGAINTKLVGNDSIGREKQIGHTFLLELKEHPENFVKVWKRDIIPLLEEFYFDNPDTLQGLFTVQGSDPKIFTVEKGILDDFTADDLVAALEDYSTWNNE